MRPVQKFRDALLANDYDTAFSILTERKKWGRVLSI